MRLEKWEIIEPVTYSEWAAPVVQVVKIDGKTIRICGDYKRTVNPMCQQDTYPLFVH